MWSHYRSRTQAGAQDSSVISSWILPSHQDHRGIYSRTANHNGAGTEVQQGMLAESTHLLVSSKPSWPSTVTYDGSDPATTISEPPKQSRHLETSPFELLLICRTSIWTQSYRADSISIRGESKIKQDTADILLVQFGIQPARTFSYG